MKNGASLPEEGWPRQRDGVSRHTDIIDAGISAATERGNWGLLRIA